MSTVLGAARVAEFCAVHSRWSYDGDALVGEVQAATFMAGIELVVAVARVAEEMDHHPDISIHWHTISFRLSTHSVGGITELDTNLAERIDALADGDRASGS